METETRDRTSVIAWRRCCLYEESASGATALRASSTVASLREKKRIRRILAASNVAVSTGGGGGGGGAEVDADDCGREVDSEARGRGGLTNMGAAFLRGLLADRVGGVSMNFVPRPCFSLCAARVDCWIWVVRSLSSVGSTVILPEIVAKGLRGRSGLLPTRTYNSWQMFSVCVLTGKKASLI